MNNAELIKALRYCGNFEDREGCDAKCPYIDDLYCPQRIMIDAADALEAADKRIAELERILKAVQENSGINFRLWQEAEARMPKEGVWIWENYYWHCSVCGENPTRGMGYVQGKNKLFRVCPNCGAKMKTVTDCHTLEEGER